MLYTRTHHTTAINEISGKHLPCGNVIPIMAVYFYATVLPGTFREL